MRYEDLPQKLQSLLNDVESTGSELRDAVDWILGEMKKPQDVGKLLPKLEALIATLQSIKGDVADPVAFLQEQIEEHPCDACEVTRDGLNPNENCDGCVSEMRQVDYVPPELR